MSEATPERLPRVTICGLGPGDPGLLTRATAELLAGPAPLLLRTSRHPGAERLTGATSFDDVYESAQSFDEVYATIASRVVEAARTHGHVVYAVPGSPLVLERSVRQLRQTEGVEVELLPAVSFLDEVWARLGVDPVDDGIRLVDGLRFATDAADQRGPLLVAHAHANWVLSDIKLALDAGPEQKVVVLQGLGTDQERVLEVGWPDLDRAVTADHLTSLYLPEVARPVGYQLARSVEMMARLRRDCPWDRQQTHHSLRRYLIEEAYEVLDAIDGLELDDKSDGVSQRAHGEPDGRSTGEQGVAWAGGSGAVGDAYAHLEEELGDLWFQILFHAQLAAEAGQFTIAEVAEGLSDKMIRRHPHVYGDEEAIDGSTPANWERLKQEEKERGSALDGIPSSLPALALAEKILKKADTAGAPAEFGELGDRLSPVLENALSTDGLGPVLLATVELARRRGLNAEQLLREAAQRASTRFRAAEAGARTDRRWVLG